MRSIVALMRVQWLTFVSYRLNVLFSLAGLVALLIPVYLVSRSLQPLVAASIAEEGAVYFGFLVTGIAVMQVVGVSMRSLPAALSSGISTGTLEALFATPTPLPQLLAGMMGHGLLWSMLRSSLLILGLLLFGGSIVPAGIPAALVAFGLLLLAHIPLGILLGAGVLVFRTTGPLGPALLGAFSLLGGVYYSTSVIPDSLRPLASIVPLTYGLRAFRRSLLAGESWPAIASDIAILAGFALALMALSLYVFAISLRHARRAGTLAQY